MLFLLLYFSSNNEEIITQIYNEYCEILNRNNSVDFDDLLLLPTKLLQKDDEVLITKTEHASNVLPWFTLEKELGITMETCSESLKRMANTE